MKAWHYLVLAAGIILFLNDVGHDFEFAKSVLSRLKG